MGIALVINNRPDGEAPDQPAGADIEAHPRCRMDYLAIPIGSAGFSEPQEKAAKALAASQGPVLGYCRSGTRSTLLWSNLRRRAAATVRTASPRPPQKPVLGRAGAPRNWIFAARAKA